MAPFPRVLAGAGAEIQAEGMGVLAPTSGAKVEGSKVIERDKWILELLEVIYSFYKLQQFSMWNCEWHEVFVE